MIKWISIPDKIKKNAYEQIAEEKGMSAFAVEKDWWVTQALTIIFEMDIAKHLVFKGGTSLSKAWNLIKRFSEDIDLAIDREFFGFKGKLSKSRITKLRKAAGVFSTGVFFEELQQKFKNKGFKDLKFAVVDAKESDQDPRIIEVYYPNLIIQTSEYIVPGIQIEIGCRSLREPFTVQSFGSLVDEIYADKDFAAPFIQVPTVNPERTFLEKIFLLQEEFNRPKEKIRVDRLSRHLYDVYHLSKNDVADKAINDKQLYETIVAHRHKFSKVGGVNYNEHNPKKINPIPATELIEAWKADYKMMLEEMIYEQNAPTFEMLIENLNKLKNRFRKTKWTFSLEFGTALFI